MAFNRRINKSQFTFNIPSLPRKLTLQFTCPEPKPFQKEKSTCTIIIIIITAPVTSQSQDPNVLMILLPLSLGSKSHQADRTRLYEIENIRGTAFRIYDL
jgi:hypothetical protein